MNIGAQNNSSGNSPIQRKSFTDNIDIRKIKVSGRFRRGTNFSDPRGRGLKGQIGALKTKFRHSYAKNLSQKNIDDMEDMIAGEMSKNPRSKAGMTRRSAKKITREAWKKVKNDSTFTKEDYKDFKKIVKTIREKSREAIMPSRDSSSGVHMNRSLDEVSLQDLGGNHELSEKITNHSMQLNFGGSQNSSSVSSKVKKFLSPKNVASNFYSRMDNLLSKNGKEPGIKEEAKKAKDMNIG